MPESPKWPESTRWAITNNEGNGWRRKVNLHVPNAAIQLTSRRNVQFFWKDRLILSGPPKNVREGKGCPERKKKRERHGVSWKGRKSGGRNVRFVEIENDTPRNAELSKDQTETFPEENNVKFPSNKF